MTPVTRQDIENATAAVGAAISALSIAEPVMARMLDDRYPIDADANASAALMFPVFRAAAYLVRVYEFQARLAAAAPAKATGEDVRT